MQRKTIFWIISVLIILLLIFGILFYFTDIFKRNNSSINNNSLDNNQDLSASDDASLIGSGEEANNPEVSSIFPNEPSAEASNNIKDEPLV